MASYELDFERVQAARQALGLSRRALAGRLGVGQGLVQSLEEGRGHDTYDLALISRLADVLGEDMRSLMRAEVPQAELVDTEGPGDIATLAAAILTAGQPLSRTEFARGLGWGLARTHAAFDGLEQSLEGTGLRLRTVGGNLRYSLRPDTHRLTSAQEDRLARAVHTIWGLRIEPARLLHRVATEDVPVTEWDRVAGINDVVAMGTLRKRGLVMVRGDNYVLTPAVAYSLGLAASRVGGAGPKRRPRKRAS